MSHSNDEHNGLLLKSMESVNELIDLSEETNKKWLSIICEEHGTATNAEFIKAHVFLTWTIIRSAIEPLGNEKLSMKIYHELLDGLMNGL